MSRLASIAIVAAVVCLATITGAEPRVPALPKDTLPAKLPIDEIPLGLARSRFVPKDNPLTEEAVQLGRKLFFDPILSVDRSMSCASCHDPAHGFAGREPRAVGVMGRQGRRNAPSLLNRAYAGGLFWDGREASLELQALGPIQDKLEMGNTVEEAVKRLQADAKYRSQFEATYSDGVTGANLGKALASFERTLLLGDSKIDRFRVGDVVHLNEQERHGLWLFESRGRCWRCHSGANFTDEQFHNTGVSWGGMPADLGRYEVTKQQADRGRFKTPTLRGVALTPPYMHDGSMATLAEVVEFYNRGGNKNPYLDPVIAPLELSKDDIASLLAFLKALSESPGKETKGK